MTWIQINPENNYSHLNKQIQQNGNKIELIVYFLTP